MSAITQADFINIIYSKIEDFIPFAENFGRSRFLIYESEIGAPDEDGAAVAKEIAEMEAIAEAFRCEIIVNGNQFVLNFYMDERNPGGFLEIVDAGMPPPLAGGKNGISTNPDGTTYASPTPVERWDEPVPGYAKNATGVINEIKTMLKSLFAQYANEAIEIAKAEILAKLKQYMSTILSSASGG